MPLHPMGGGRVSKRRPGLLHSPPEIQPICKEWAGQLHPFFPLPRALPMGRLANAESISGQSVPCLIPPGSINETLLGFSNPQPQNPDVGEGQ